MQKNWPYDYVVEALLFFGCSTEQQNVYVEGRFSEVLFHGPGADFFASSSLQATQRIFDELIQVGTRWSHWTEDSEGSANRNTLLEELFERMVSLQPSELDWPSKRDRLRELAIRILVELGWTGGNLQPFCSCRELLDEFSYGAFSASCPVDPQPINPTELLQR